MSDSYEAARQAAEIERVRQKNAPFTTDLSGMTLRSGKRIKFNDADGTAGLSLQCAPTMAANVTLTLPSVAPTAGQVLRGNASVPTTLEWAAPEDLGTLGDGMTNPMTTLYDMIIGDVGGAPIRLPAGGPNTELITTVDGQVGWAARGMTNPMTTEGDLIYRDATGPTRLGIGTNGHVLKSNGTTVTWAAENADVGFANPMTTAGDVIVGGASGTPTRLATGSSNQVLTSDGVGGVSWTTPSTGMTNPMTTAGDVMYGGASGTPTRLGVPGTNPGNRALLLNNGATACVWSGHGLHGTNDAVSSLALGGATNTNAATNAVLVGNGVTSSYTGQQDCVVIGASAESINVIKGTAVGAASSANTEGTAVGYDADAYGIVSTAIGATADANWRGTAIGYGAQATGVASGGTSNYEAAVAVGHKASATGNGSTAVGAGASVTVDFGSAFGPKTTTSGAYSTCLGFNSTASSTESTSLGSFSNASASYAIALGGAAQAHGIRGLAIGYYAQGTQDTVAIGYNTDFHTGSTAGVPYTCQGGVVLGSYAQAAGIYNGSSWNNVVNPVVVGTNACYQRRLGPAVTVVGSDSANVATWSTDRRLEKATILGSGLLSGTNGNVNFSNRVLIGAEGRVLLGGKLPTNAWNVATNGPDDIDGGQTAQTNVADGVLEVFGNIKFYTPDKSKSITLAIEAVDDGANQYCIRAYYNNWVTGGENNGVIGNAY